MVPIYTETYRQILAKATATRFCHSTLGKNPMERAFFRDEVISERDVYAKSEKNNSNERYDGSDRIDGL